MDNSQEIKDLHKRALRIIKEKIKKIDNNEEFSNSKEQKRIIVETIPLINSIFFEIRKYCPIEIKDLSISHSSSISVIRDLEKILNIIGLGLSPTSKKTFKITAITKNI